jgi:hypothetical protein
MAPAVEFEAGQRLLRELSHWTPPGGVVSVYLAIDPGDRGEGWRIELRDKLRDVDEAAARRVLERFPADTPTHGRTHIGFLEVDGEAREVWESVQVALQRTEVMQRQRPYVTPLMRILDDGWPVGVVVVASSTAGRSSSPTSTGRSESPRSATRRRAAPVPRRRDATSTRSASSTTATASSSRRASSSPRSTATGRGGGSS